MAAKRRRGKTCRTVRIRTGGSRCMCPSTKGQMRFAKKNRC